MVNYQKIVAQFIILENFTMKMIDSGILIMSFCTSCKLSVKIRTTWLNWF